ncbi:fimbrial protein [Pseudomonas protegens]|uniref:fimbrial protein n=1 Tax=Pseudomonas protegens TaxID=380021 RepID=UPI0011CD99A2|nr:fimbrial protein [Pseudomonas protegens]
MSLFSLFRFFVVSSFLLCWVEGAHAACKWGSNDPFKKIRNFTYDGRGLSLPQDIADGEVYTATFTSYYQKIVVDCEPRTPSGIKVNSAVSDQPATGGTFPFKSSNFSWSLNMLNYFPMQSVSAPGNNYTHGMGSDFGFTNSFELRIKKEGDINESFTIPAGLLGTWVTTDGFQIATITLLSPITISAASCKTPSVSVNMGEYQISDIEKSTEGSINVPFDIGLIDCPSSVTRVEYLLKANTKVVDNVQGIVSLDSGSTAKGVSLQIKDSRGVPLKLDVYNKFSGSNNGGGFKIPMNASYVRVAGEKINAGSANTSLTFIMKYL